MRKFWVSSVFFLGLILFGATVVNTNCARVVDQATTTTSTSTSASTSTSTTSTSTTSTTSTTIFEITGTISDYGGSASQLTVEIYKDQISGTPSRSVTVSVTGTGNNKQATYELTLEAAGNYYVVAYDAANIALLEVDNWIGSYGWTQVERVSIDEIGSSLVTRSASLAVSSSTTADFLLHEIIAPEGSQSVILDVYPPVTGLTFQLFDVADISAAADLGDETPYRTKTFSSLTEGQQTLLEIPNIAPGTYYCIVSDDPDFSPDAGDFIGAAGWDNSDPIDFTTVFNDAGALWQNIQSFEVTTTSYEAGITLHVME